MVNEFKKFLLIVNFTETPIVNLFKLHEKISFLSYI
jgi:hypothetical protein